MHRVRVLRLAAIALALCAAGGAQLNQNCIVSVLNRNVTVNADGSWVLPNVPANSGQVKARATCVNNGLTLSGESAFFTVPVNGAANLPTITLGPSTLVPDLLSIAPASPSLSAVGQTVQLSVSAHYPNNSTKNVTAASAGTNYTSSNPAIASVTANGLVTAVASGTVVIQAINDGAPAMASVLVVLAGKDSDGDGILDDAEIRLGLDPNNPLDAREDPDRDGLTNLQEFQLGTDIHNPDSDGDGLTDGQEVLTYHTNPLLPDTDGDGIPDGVEVQIGTNPLNSASYDLKKAVGASTLKPLSFVLITSVLTPGVSVQLSWKVTLIDGKTVLDLTADPRTAYSSSNLTSCDFGGQKGQVFAVSPGSCLITISNNTLSVVASGSVKAFTPTALSFLDMPGFANNVDVSGNYAYVAAGSAGLQVVDVSDHSNPRIVAARPLPGNANDVVVAGSYAYVAAGIAGVQIVNISNPLAPVLSGSLSTGDVAWDVVVKGNRAYVANGASGLVILDVSTPAAPIRLGSLSLVGTSKGVDVDTVRQIAVVGRGANGLAVVNIANPAAPALLGTLPAADVRDVAVSGNFVFLADFQGSFKSVDLTNPSGPGLRATTPTATGGFLTDVVVFGNIAAGADLFFVNGVPLIDVSTPASPLPRTILDFSKFRDDNATGIAMDATYVYMTAEPGNVANGTENGVNGITRLYIGQYQSIQDAGGIPPTVSIVSPISGSTVTEASTLNVTVSAADDVAVASVSLFQNGQLAETKTAAPYQFSFLVPVGLTSITLSASATDFGGNLASSSSVTLNVVPYPLPTVQIISPASGAVVREGATIPVVVQAAGTVAIKQVDLAVNGQPIASDASGPYQFLFTVPVGATNLIFTASALDNLGKLAIPASVNISVAPDPRTTLQGSTVDTSNGPIVGAQVVADLNGLSAEVFNSATALAALPNLTGRTPDVIRVISTPNMPNPGRVFGADPFGFGSTPSRTVRFSGRLLASAAGTYGFSLGVNAGGRLIVNGVVVIDRPNSTGAFQTATGTIVLSSGSVPIELQTFDNGSPEVVLRYTSPAGELQVIPPSALVPALTPYQTTSGAAGAFSISGVPTAFGNVGVSATFTTGNGTTVSGKTAVLAPVAGGITNLGQVQLTSIVTMTFESLASPGTTYTSLNAPYNEAGFTITPTTGFCLVQSQNPDLFMGSTGLSNCYTNETNTLTKVGGGAFTLVSMDLAPFGRSYGAGAQVTFVGKRVDLSTVSATFTAPPTFNFNTYNFPGFSDLVSVSWTHVAPYHQFDNIKLSLLPLLTTTVTGQVKDGNGQPVVGAAVSAFNTFTGLTTTGGVFSIAGVPADRGNIVIKATATINGSPSTGSSSAVAPVVGGTTNAGTITVIVGSIMTFEPLATPGTSYTSTTAPYTEAGFTITPGSSFCLIQMGNTDLFMGSTGLSSCTANGINTLTKVGGGAFALLSMDLAPFGRSYGGGAPVAFVGHKAGGGTVSVTFNAPQSFNFSTYQFAGFDNLISVTWTHVGPYHQFDNVRLQ